MDSKRKVTFTGLTADPFQVSLSFSGDSKPCCLLTDKIVTYTVAGLNSAMERYNETGKVVLHFTLDSNGLLKMSNAEAVIQVEETIQVDKLVPDPDAGMSLVLCACCRCFTLPLQEQPRATSCLMFCQSSS